MTEHSKTVHRSASLPLEVGLKSYKSIYLTISAIDVVQGRYELLRIFEIEEYVRIIGVDMEKTLILIQSDRTGQPMQRPHIMTTDYKLRGSRVTDRSRRSAILLKRNSSLEENLLT